MRITRSSAHSSWLALPLTMTDKERIEIVSNALLEDLIEYISLGLCHQTHRAAKLGYLQMEESAQQEEKKYRITDEKGFDVFGESSSTAKKQYECECPHCERTLSAQRFAPHLEKCMGMGRNSSRIASKRIASSGKSGSLNTSGIPGGDSDIEELDKSSDNDWNEKPVVKRNRKKKRDTSANSNGIRGNSLPKTHPITSSEFQF